MNSHQKFESHLTIFFVYNLETHNTDRARPYVFCFYRLSQLAGRCNCDLSPHELEKSARKILPLVEIIVLKQL